MKNFVIIVNEYKDKDLNTTKQLIDYIEKKGGKAVHFISNVEAINGADFELSDIPKDAECIIVLGGDGTLIRAATKVESLLIPILGINMGTLGYLCEVDAASAYVAIDRLFDDDYTMEDRLMLCGNSTHGEGRRLALNDIVIHRSGSLQILNLHVYVNGEFLNTYHADGIIVSTPTGSTGYNMSAGGPIVDPKGKLLLLTPINAHNLNSKSIVLGADDIVEIEIGSRRAQKDEKACVSFDGDTAIELKVGDKFTISKATHYTKVCKLNKKSFLEILRKKMETYS